MNELRERLLAQGASLATVDAFESAVRKAEDATVAAALRSAARDTEYALNSIGPIALEAAAKQIEGMRR